MYIIAGLGNPTKTYEGTRHNIGFEVIDRLADRCRTQVTVRKNKVLYAKTILEGERVILINPRPI